MLQYILRRVLSLIPLMLGVATLVFILMRVIPGDVAILVAGDGASDEAVESIRQELGLDRPLPIQYIDWIAGIARGNLGTSLRTKEQVMDRLLKRWPVTMELALSAMFIAIVIAIPIGVASAMNQDGPVDYSVRVIALLGLSVPEFWSGTILIVVLALWFRYSPPLGYAGFFNDPGANLQQTLLPAAVISASQIGALTRLSRATMLEVLRQDYIRTAWAKGLRERKVLYTHALRNALIPVVTVLGLSLGRSLGGTVIMESIFRLPGIGSTIVESIILRDYPVVQGAILVFSFLFAFINLLTDITYSWLDPRIRYGS